MNKLAALLGAYLGWKLVRAFLAPTCGNCGQETHIHEFHYEPGTDDEPRLVGWRPCPCGETLHG